jgi:hypothetical protein
MNSIALAGATHVVPETALPAPSAPILTARDYERAYLGKVMIIQRNDVTPLATSDFFELEAVGTHPTGLIVTGLFENGRRSHLMATAVRVANKKEIEWRHSHRN